MTTQEFNFDGLVGPTHNYAGLSHGNVASKTNQHAVSSPKKAALQGLQKMKFVRDLGVPQCVLPPLPRPNLSFLRTIGFSGQDHQLIERAYQVDPVLVSVCFSASNMWTANAATISPAADCPDRRLHLTPANLASNLHRSLEAPATTHVLKQVFANDQMFQVHEPLLANMALTDEGAANHTRFCQSFDAPGVELFVYGSEFLAGGSVRPRKFPARQTLEACQAIARRHGVPDKQVVFIQQNPEAIDAGVFHNDVIAVGHQNVLLAHEHAFHNSHQSLETLKCRYAEVCGQELHVVTVHNEDLAIEDAVSSYLFNSQILTRSDGNMALVCPADCEENERAFACTQAIVAGDHPISEVHFLDLRQSMNNGGGPACLRLRVVLNEEQQQRFHQPVRLTDELYASLVAWVERNYRDSLAPQDLLDPCLLDETRRAFDELSSLLAISLESN